MKMSEHKLRNRSIITTATLAIIGTLAYVFWPASHSAAIDPRTRVYADYSACLLTGSAGITQSPAAAAWAGMQQASSRTSERISTLPITGPQDLATAEQFLNTLALRHCDLIITAGALPDQAAEARAAAFPQQHFLAIGGTSARSNLSFLSDGSPAALTVAIQQDVTTDYNAHAPAN
jgi:basic membrane lipoprotein Med (substrate-binding protein (PBP1-ABC) superfamily)